MPQTLTLLLDLGPGEKDVTGKWAPVSKRKTACTSQPSGLPGAPRSGCREPEPGQGSHLAPSQSRDRVTSRGCLYREGRVPKEVRAFSQAALLMDTPV
jgi:hypothetical protein